MDKDRSIVAQVCLKVAGEVYASIADASQGFQPDLLEAVFRKCWQLHDATMKAALQPVGGGGGGSGFVVQVPAPQPVEDPGAPFGPPAQPVPPAPVSVPAPQPVAQSQPVAQPSQPVPTQVLSGPACPQCQVPMVKTENWEAIAAAVANKTPPGKPPPYWKCPMGTYDKQTKTAFGCQGCQWDAA